MPGHGEDLHAARRVGGQARGPMTNSIASGQPSPIASGQPSLTASGHSAAFGHPSLQRYDEHLCLQSVSQRTREEYGRYLRRLGQHTGRDPEALAEEEARSYLIHLKEQKRYAPGSMRIAVAALRMFYNGMLQKEWRLFDLVRSPDRRKLPLVLTREQVAKFLCQLREPRFRTLLTLIYSCGLRVGEAVAIEVRDIQSAQRRIHIREAKGGKDRLVPLPETLLAMLREFWKSHRHPRLLFPGVSCAWRERGGHEPRRTEAPIVRVERAALLPAGCGAGGAAAGGDAAHAAAQLCHTPAGGRGEPAADRELPRARVAGYNGHLHASDCRE